MRNNILIEIRDVTINDFSGGVPSPEFLEEMDGGVRILFNDITELKQYQDSLLAGNTEDAVEDSNTVTQRINTELQKSLDDNQVVLDSIKAYAKALFQFVTKREGHRQDKLIILDEMISGMPESSNNWELENTIKEAAYELGTMVLNHNLTFSTYAHNDVDYNFDQIRNQLVKDLTDLRTGLVNTIKS